MKGLKNMISTIATVAICTIVRQIKTPAPIAVSNEGT